MHGGNQLLHPEGVPEILLDGAHTFLSTFRPGRAFAIVVALSVFLFVDAFVAALVMATSQGKTAAILLGLALAVALIGSILAYYIWQSRKAVYEREVELGSWSQGVIVTRSGDLVIRMEGGLLGGIYFACEGVFVSRADVEHRWSFAACSRQRHLVLHYMTEDVKPLVTTVPQGFLRDDVNDVAGAINGSKEAGFSGAFAR